MLTWPLFGLARPPPVTRVQEGIAASTFEAGARYLGDERTMLAAGAGEPVRGYAWRELVLVGRSNAGKSTLLNALTASDVLAEDKLFATLDPTSRRLRFPRDREVVLTDTVGFIRQLPKTLVNAFRATLEELSDADLLLHVVDASDPEQDRHIEAVEGILSSLGLASTPRLVVFNKGDRLPGGVEGDAATALSLSRGGLCVSAATREGFGALLSEAEELLWREGRVATPHGEPFDGGHGLRTFARVTSGGPE